MGKGLSLVYCDRTDIGRKRSNNQDSKAVLPPSGPQQYRTRGWLFLVADGMGAHAAGEMASAIAAERVPLVYEKTAQRSPPLALRHSMDQVNGEINAKGQGDPELKGMGTTCTVLALLPRGALVGHIGDSRAYRLRSGTIEQLTRDHSLVWELESAGAPDAAARHGKNIITRSMGPHPRVDVDIEGPFPVADGDVFLLCSDGLSGQVADAEIGLLAAELEPKEAAAALVGLTLIRGAPDNITVIVARAGVEEISKTSPGDEPWPMSDPPTAQPQAAARPWRMLALAAVSFLATLLISPWSDVPGREWVAATIGENLMHPISVIASVGCLVVCLLSLLIAWIGFLPAAPVSVRHLMPGKQIGKGPYRSYQCKASQALLEGIVTSIESAADGLKEQDRERTLQLISSVRQHVAENQFSEAVMAVANAIAIYTKTVHYSRSGDTAPGRPAQL